MPVDYALCAGRGGTCRKSSILKHNVGWASGGGRRASALQNRS